ncbi:MAG: hypothetical protein GYB67_02465, partial [Chloroflexi bacterium]|nr:hypothetical protein [Chloroflexota bacterium]
GPAGLGLLDVSLESDALRVVATLSLTLVLFNDAISLDLGEVRRHGRLSALVLGPGTLFSALLIALAGAVLLGLGLAEAAILGAALASTDPVLLRGLLRHPRIPNDTRLVLRLESGMNDAVLLPIVIIAMIFLDQAQAAAYTLLEWAQLFINLFLLGPGAGVAIGLMSIATIDMVRRRIGVRRDYESLYSLGVAFTAFAAAEALGGSGFLAAFAAGLTISALDVELCECFVEYGETTEEMALLITFVLFGSSLIWSGFGTVSLMIIPFALFVLLARPAAFRLSLARTALSRRSRSLIAWFGPRGLSSLLLILLPVFAGLPGSTELFNVASIVVLLSVMLYGFAPMVLYRQDSLNDDEPLTAQPVVEPTVYQLPSNGGQQPPASTASTTEMPPQNVTRETAAVTGDGDYVVDPRISLEQLRQRWQDGDKVIIADARSERTYRVGKLQALGAVWLPQDRAVAEAEKLDVPKDAVVVVYCACPDEATSLRVVQELQSGGWKHSYALTGGLSAWQEAGLPVAEITSELAD